jgi:transposase
MAEGQEKAGVVVGKRGKGPGGGETPRQQIRKAKATTRRQFSAEEKIRIVMEGMRGEEPVSVICRREGIHATVYYRWMRDALEAAKARLRGDTLREMNRSEVQELKRENEQLKGLVADYALQVAVLKKSLTGS